MARPKLTTEQHKVSKSVTMKREIVDHLTIMGDGNLSLGIEIIYGMVRPTLPTKEEAKSILDTIDELLA